MRKVNWKLAAAWIVALPLFLICAPFWPVYAVAWLCDYYWA